jgi:RNA polymerase sigma factor (sigma-70 family)
VIRKDPLAHPEKLIRQVYAYVAYRIGAGPEAEDVTSETFERALRYRSSYDPRKAEPIAWLLGIARRCADDALAARRPSAGELEDVRSGQELEDEVARRVDLHAAVALLDERDRELLALRYGADLKARQIAELLGERTNTIEVGLHRALRRLRGLLEQQTNPTREGAGQTQQRSAGERPASEEAGGR